VFKATELKQTQMNCVGFHFTSIRSFQFRRFEHAVVVDSSYLQALCSACR